MYFKTLLFISLLGFSYLFADTKLLILGSGTPNPNPERSGSAYAIIANGGIKINPKIISSIYSKEGKIIYNSNSDKICNECKLDKLIDKKLPKIVKKNQSRQKMN